MKSDLETLNTTVAGSGDVWSLIGADEDVVNDLRALGITVGDTMPVDLDQARRDVLASSLLRRQAMTIAASAQPSASRDAEIQFIVARYAPQLEMHRRWGAELERAVQALAEQTKHESGYVGKKKSRDVGAGTYGYKTYAEGVELQDEATFIAWAEQQAPETLRVTIKLPLKDAREFRTEDELADCKREVIKKDATNLAESLADTLPPGFVKVAASDEFYAKPLPAAAISGARI